jgi:hypothetical protein
MRKLIKNILCFLTPVLIIIIVLPVNKRLKYQGLKDDCFNHGIWIYDRIYSNTKPIDFAFLGSSHTINGINDKLISDNTKCGQAVNLGYCRLGRNLSYVLLKELISKRDIKLLILEVREDENRYSHPIFPYIAKSKDVILANPFFNKDILADVWTHFVYKIELLQTDFFQQGKAAPIRTENFGFASSKDTASFAVLDEVKLRRSIPKTPLTTLEEDFHGSFSKGYIKKISALCDKNNIRITFLFLPSYGSIVHKPNQYDNYSKYGEVLIAPKHIFENQTNWYDENHLNQTGANELSFWLSDKINNSWQFADLAN